jgi:hypothetical protein
MNNEMERWSVTTVRSLVRIAGITTTSLVALWLAARFFAWEPDGLERGTLLYQLKIPAQAKDWPLWQPTSQVLYDFRNTDGEAHGFTRVHYTASLSVDALQRSLQGQGYVCTEPASHSLVCDLLRGEVCIAQVLAESGDADGRSKLTVLVFVK